MTRILGPAGMTRPSAPPRGDRPLLAVAAWPFALAPAAASAAATPRASLTDIEGDVMCTECHEPLAVAQSLEADSERAYIRGLIAQGETKSQILQRTWSRQYGPAVLGKPPAHGFNLAVYMIPLAILALGAAVLAVALPRWRRRTRAAAREPAAAPPPLDAADAERLDDELSQFELRVARRPAGAARRYIESGALTPSSPSDSAIVVCAATDSAIRCDSTASGVAPTTRQSRRTR